MEGTLAQDSMANQEVIRRPVRIVITMLGTGETRPVIVMQMEY
jgi:hypothetical protein